MAIEYLHKNNIIYRDLKPENVLIDKNGFIKLTDFGLSKEDINDSHSATSFCGTPEYLAPEVLLNNGYGKPVDWWSLGCIIYEMVTGIPPFFAKDKTRLFKKIQNTEPQYPEFLSKEILDLIQKLLKKDPAQRLGSTNDAEEIKSHPFFTGIKWEDFLNKSRNIRIPFKPKLRGRSDTKYFDPAFTGVTPKETPEDSDNNNDTAGYISGFSYDNTKNNV